VNKFYDKCSPALIEVLGLEEDAPKFDAPVNFIDEKKQDFIN
jgi:hypothetical protein